MIWIWSAKINQDIWWVKNQIESVSELRALVMISEYMVAKSADSFASLIESDVLLANPSIH